MALADITEIAVLRNHIQLCDNKRSCKQQKKNEKVFSQSEMLSTCHSSGFADTGLADVDGGRGFGEMAFKSLAKSAKLPKSLTAV